MSSATPWWGTLVVAAIGLAGVLTSQWLAGHREKARSKSQQDERDRQDKTEAYAKFLSEDQWMIVAIEQFILGHTSDAAVYQQWAALSTSSYLVTFRTRSRDVVDGVDRLMNAVLPLLALVRLNIHDYAQYKESIDSQSNAGDRLGMLMRQDAVGESYWPPFSTLPDRPAFLQRQQGRSVTIDPDSAMKPTSAAQDEVSGPTTPPD